MRGGGRGTESGREGGREGREKGKSKKRERESEWSQRADTTCGCGGSDVVMEGDKFSGKTNCLEILCTDENKLLY